MQSKKLNVELIGSGSAWLDTGTHESLLQAGNFIQTIEERQGIKVACLEEIAYKNKWINEKQIMMQAEKLKKSEYGKYLKVFIENLEK